jgi:hypothetical protein
MRQEISTRKFAFGIVIGASLVIMVTGCSKKADVPSEATIARRAVKSTLDPAAKEINKTIRDTTIEDIIANKSSGLLAGRVDPFEKTVWRVKAKVESIELKKDGDYYMVLRGEKGGQTVVEVPDPDTCKGSPFEGEILETRKALEDKFHPTKDKKEVNEDATITGVGFMGFNANPAKKGSGGFSGARLMPGTDVKFDN